MDIHAHNGHFGKEKINVLQVRPGVTVKQVAKAGYDNNLDEILLQTEQGRVLIYADELSVKRYKGLPSAGEEIILSNINVKGKVLFADNENNEEWVTGAFTAAVAVPVGAIAGALITEGIDTVGITDAFKLALAGAAVGGTATGIGFSKLAQALRIVKEDDTLLQLVK